MQLHLFLCILSLCISTSNVLGKTMQPQEIKGWLELDALQKNIRTMSTKYENLQAHLKEETNLILEKSMHAAQELAQQDPYAALIMNYDMQRLIDKVDATSIDIDAINEKYKKLSNEIKTAIQELLAMRRKSLQFP